MTYISSNHLVAVAALERGLYTALATAFQAISWRLSADYNRRSRQPAPFCSGGEFAEARLSAMDDADEFRVLLHDAMQGSVSASRVILEKYSAVVIAAVRRKLPSDLRTRFDSADFAQAVWASFFAAPATANDIATPEALVRWLSVMARNKVVDEFRRRFQLQKNNIDREMSLDGSPSFAREVPQIAPSPSQIAVANEIWERMLEGRKPLEQMMLKLRRQGQTHDEIAETLGISERTVRRCMKRAFEEQARC